MANTPSRVLPPSRGGRTVGDQPFDSEKFQISHRWVNCSMPRSAFSSRYSGSNTMRDFNSCTSPLCRGMPNFVGKSLCMRAMMLNESSSAIACLRIACILPELYHRRHRLSII